MLRVLKGCLEDLADVIYPRICATCNEHVPLRGNVFCVHCLAELPYTGYHNIPDNPFEQQFWGRVPVSAGASMFYFIPGGKTQRLLHSIKYGGRRELAVKMGQRYAVDLRHSERFEDLDMIIPVPLHWKKQRKRGYNQSEAFANGISSGLGVPVRRRILRRHRAGVSLTSLTRTERLDTVARVFSIHKGHRIQGLRILLVDDVLTTGATLEICGKILADQGATVFMCTLACGRI